jgi:hypothetical protein
MLKYLFIAFSFFVINYSYPQINVNVTGKGTIRNPQTIKISDSSYYKYNDSLVVKTEYFIFPFKESRKFVTTNLNDSTYLTFRIIENDFLFSSISTNEEFVFVYCPKRNNNFIKIKRYYIFYFKNQKIIDYKIINSINKITFLLI